jgi:hypothetical protein
MRLMAVAGAAALAGAVLAIYGAAQGQMPATSFSVQLSQERTVLSLAERQALGFSFGPPDGYLGVERQKQRYSFFVSGGSNKNCSTPNQQGSYRLGGNLSGFSDIHGCSVAMRPGDAPDGYTFDRNYAGGGPVAEFSEHGEEGLLLVYHGEYHPGPTCQHVPWFYSALGMAVSWDGGAHFFSLGEIVQPYPTRAEWQALQPCQNAHVGSGTLVVADENGNPLPPAALSDPKRGYFYIFYTDSDPSLPKPCGQTSVPVYCVAVARAPRQAVIAAAMTGDTAAFPTLFKKYYKSSSSETGGFIQPATSGDPNDAVNSGHYTPVFARPIGQPTVLYDSRINQFLAAYESNWILYMQAAPNLLQWSGTILPGAMADDSPNQIGYPTLVGEGSNPAIGGRAPYLFYMSSVAPFPTWGQQGTTYASRRVEITLQ